MAAAAASQSDTVSRISEAFSGQTMDEYEGDEESRMEASQHSYSVRDRDKKIGHRRVDKAGIVSYKKKPTSELMAAIQLGIGQSVGGLSAKPERDVLMQDFGVVEVVFFPSEGSNLTPAHRYSDFRFKTYAPVAFRYFRDLFGIQPDDFMLSLCDEPLKELSNPGASGSIFYLTHDDEFIIKTVQHKESDFLQKLLPGYFLNISQNKRTLLPKFYGLFCYQCGGKNIRFTVMNNLLPSTVKLHEKYDMKGSTYKRKASKHERSKGSPTLKDLDFMDNHPEGLTLEKDTYDALIKTLQRDCRVLESFKIMDYSLLVGIYNLDLANKEKQNMQSSELSSGTDVGGTATGSSDGHRPSGHSVLQRGKSFKTRIGQYSTPMESIQGNTDLTEDLLEDGDVPPGGIPARNHKGERLLLYLGIIDILQSFRLKKRLEHTVKSMVIDGDTISVHRPSYYAQRFLQYHATRVFKKAQTALKHSPSKKKSITNKARSQAPIPEQPEVGGVGGVASFRAERTGRTISFSDETPVVGSGAVGSKPDLLPEYSTVAGGSTSNSPPSQSPVYNVNGNTRQQKRSEAFNLTTYPSEDALSAGTASTVSLRGVGVTYAPGGHRGPSPPLSLSESTPTHTDFTEGTPSFTNSSPSCSSDVMGSGHSCNSTTIISTFTATTIGSSAVFASFSSCHATPHASPQNAPMDDITPTAPAVPPLPDTSAFCYSSETTFIADSSFTSAATDMGSSNRLDAAEVDSPVRLPSRSHHPGRTGIGGAISPLTRPQQLGNADVIDDNVVLAGQGEVSVKVTPESPTLRESAGVRASVDDLQSNAVARVSVAQSRSLMAAAFTAATTSASSTSKAESEAATASSDSSTTQMEPVTVVESEIVDVSDVYTRPPHFELEVVGLDADHITLWHVIRPNYEAMLRASALGIYN